MNRTLKTLLLLLLIAALPLQGAAAAMRLSCGPGHSHPAQAVPAIGAHHHSATAPHSDTNHAAFKTTANADHAPAAPDGHAHSYCSVCAACCVGSAAPPSTRIPTAARDGSDFIAVVPAPLLAGFIPASLERPPRTISA